MNNRITSTTRRTGQLGMLLLAAATRMTSCSEKNITPIASAPDNMGSITLGKTRIGTGQTIGATCDIPTGGAEIDRVTYSWVLDQGIPAEVTPKDGKSAVTFTAPTSAGEHSVGRVPVPDAGQRRADIQNVDHDENLHRGTVRRADFVLGRRCR